MHLSLYSAEKIKKQNSVIKIKKLSRPISNLHPPLYYIIKINI